MTEQLAAPDFFASPERICQTRRSKEIARLAAYFDGEQYRGRPDFFAGLDRHGNVVPLRERAPCIVYPLPRAACNQATRFTFGEGRFPTVAVKATKRTEENDDGAEREVVDAAVPELAVTEEEASQLTAYLASVIESARLKSVMRTLCRAGTSQRTAVAVLGVKRGKFVVQMPRARDCYAEFVDGDPDGDVIRMTWCFQFEKEVEVDGCVVTRSHLYRRDFTDTETVTYKDAPYTPGKEVVWERDEEQTKPHDLGFCPVYWIRNLPEPHCGDIDGQSLYEDLEDEFDVLNFALSQRHRGIVYFGTPQAWETGISDDEDVGDTGRTARPAKTTTAPSPKDPFRKAGSARARKTAPDQIWSAQSETAKFGVMETTGAAFDAASKHVLDIRGRILEAIDVVLLDPMSVASKGEMSAKALALMYAPLLALVDELRDCWWASGLARLLSGVLRITAALDGKGIYVANAATVASICKRFNLETEDGETIWVPPVMVPSWGAYFSPSNDDVQKLVDATAKAKDAGLIRPETATRNVAPQFGVADIEAECEGAEGLDVEAAERRLEGAKGSLPDDEDEVETPRRNPIGQALAASGPGRERVDQPVAQRSGRGRYPMSVNGQVATASVPMLPKGKLLGGRKAA